MKRTMTKRFYVGSKSISESDGDSSFLTTLGEALENAREKVESGERNICYIVQIVKIVRRANQPIIVEDVR